MHNDLFNSDNACFRFQAADWRGAVLKAGAVLTERGSATKAYAESMVRAVEEYGPYVVIAPGIALAHARPDESVLCDDLVLVTLAEPVSFGHDLNDPVELVFAFCASNSESHIQQLQKLAEALSEDAWVEHLKKRTA